MRVIAGKARRLPLKSPSGMNTRPTTDRIKETLFNMIQPYMCECRFLDLFSGSGAIGIEALSRGASVAVFVEKNPRAVECIRANLKFTKLEQGARVMKADALSALPALEGEESFDCIFMDPPYGRGIEREILQYLAGSSLMGPHTLVIVEADLDTEFDYLEELGFTFYRYKKYKTNAHVFIVRKDV